MRSLINTILAICLTASFSIAQNLDKQKTKVVYTQLPLKPLPEGITKYWVNTDIAYLYSGDSKTHTMNSIQNSAKIDHLEKTNDEGLELLVRLEPYYKSEVKFETITKTEKRDDKEISVTYHYLTFGYKYPLYFEVKLPGEMEPFYSKFAKGSDGMSSYRSSEYRSSSALRGWWSDNYKSVQAKLRSSLFQQNVDDMKATLAEKFSYRKNNLYSEFLTVKKFKKFEYNDLDEAWAKAKIALDKISENDIVFSTDFNQSMLEAIAIWQNALNESDLEDKKTRINKKVTEAIYNNIFLAYTMMSNFEKAEEVKQIAEERINKRAIDNYNENFLIGRKKRFSANEGRIPDSI
ncbi:hypothetical protein LVD15_14925 [Fulvivirga maritima]|uniref:hypothetical protein n=1 Tax=Fulvivirga maritima TaxID=2904247 RepID=UPI001F2DB14B|nr:hypothetical protein [Fulvivirga maritima]UII24616.1 hypothetical protein LVD15_14925 [Fulvivirga maritima]